VAELRAAVAAAPADALPPLDTAELDAALPSGDPIRLSGAASSLALRLARIELLGAEPASARAAWKIADPDAAIDLEAGLAAALAENRVGAFLAGLNPQHPDYAALRTAYAAETDPARRHVLAQNMERWRWMPRQLGGDYLLVNAASQEVRLWRRGQGVGAWRVIVGKPATPTPVFAATVTGVTFNPWWDVPANIVRESVGVLMRRHPAAARARGYARIGGRIRQRPGPANSLGLMKLVMPNPYNVYLHDTPNRDLFQRDQRAFSHGCVRVGDALDLATTLLDSTQGRAAIDALVAKGDTVTLDLPSRVPVYITYFTAGLRGDGSFGYFTDIYGRDTRIAAASPRSTTCRV
jgi:murein L,D-transpeptidase YcbB/YkuD